MQGHTAGQGQNSDSNTGLPDLRIDDAGQSVSHLPCEECLESVQKREGEGHD